MRLLISFFMLAVVAGCGASGDTASKGMPDGVSLVRAWYDVELGGRPEAGRSQYYYVKVNLGENCRADSLKIEGESMVLMQMEDPVLWRAYRHFENGDDFPAGVLNGTMQLTCDEKRFHVPIDSIHPGQVTALP